MPETDTSILDNLARLREQFPEVTERESLDCPALNVMPYDALKVLKALRDDYGYTFLTDVTAIDWEERYPRFEVVWHLYHPSEYAYLRVASPCPNDEKPEMSSVVSLWATADWHERETYDMFGIHFTGHPNMTRILMWEGYPYYPLRKEFPLAGEETELPAPDVVEHTGTKVKPAPMMGGPFHAEPGAPMSRMEPRARDQSWTEQSEKPTSES